MKLLGQLKLYIISLLIAALIFPLVGVRASFGLNDPDYPRQWYLQKIQADSAWTLATSSPEVIVAVIDSGIDITHPDLKNNLWINTNEISGNRLDDDQNGFLNDIHGWNFIDNNNDPNPNFSKTATVTGLEHGTLIAGIIGASGNNSFGISGVTWRVKIMPLKALDDTGEGRVGDVIKAIDYAINNGADIINLSFVGFTYSEALREALIRAYKAGVVVVAAAGNDKTAGTNGINVDKTPLYPACYYGDNGEKLALAVAATDTLDQKATFSSYGSTCINLTAPGISFYGAVPYRPNIDQNQYDKYFDGYWSGTSMATAVVSGALALIKQTNPNFNREQLVANLLKNTDNIDKINPAYIGRLGSGRLNLARSVYAATNQLKSYAGRILINPYYFNQLTSRLKNYNQLKITAADGGEMGQINFSTAVNNKNLSGANIVSGDLSGEQSNSIVIGAPLGSSPQITIFNASGKLIKQFLAYDQKFTGGVNVALGDINGDGRAEIVTAPGSGLNSQIKIFNASGKLAKQFLAYDQKFTGGVNVALGDINGDGRAEIVTTPLSGGGPQVKVFDNQGQVLSQFMAGDKNWRGGLNVSVANVWGLKQKNRTSIIVAPVKNDRPLVKIYSASGQLQSQFLAYNANFKNGVSLASGDLNNDGLAEIITGAGPGGSPHVRVFKANGELWQSFYAYNADFSKGINVGYLQINY